MIVATPLNLPRIEPDNWDIFYKIWNEHSGPVKKIKVNNNPFYTKEIGDDTAWQGLDIYKKTNINLALDAPYFNIKHELPIMFNSIENLPIKNIYSVRILQSKIEVLPHTDRNKDEWAVRAFLQYTDTNPQWYFTDQVNLKTRHFLNLPNDTNWFAYNDASCLHGTVYNPLHPKLLVQVHFFGSILNLIQDSINKYKDYTIDL
jgi:hypothetical protein